jgi:hypothetical protein
MCDELLIEYIFEIREAIFFDLATISEKNLNAPFGKLYVKEIMRQSPVTEETDKVEHICMWSHIITVKPQVKDLWGELWT